MTSLWYVILVYKWTNTENAKYDVIWSIFAAALLDIMGLQVLVNCGNKRNREDCMLDEDGIIPTKLSKTISDDLWGDEEYYHPAGKCYQCGPIDNGPSLFYGSTNCSSEQYSLPCWSLPQTPVVISSSSASSISNSNNICASSSSVIGSNNMCGTTGLINGAVNNSNNNMFVSTNAGNNCDVIVEQNGSMIGYQPIVSSSRANTNNIIVPPTSTSSSTTSMTSQQQTIRCEENGKSYLDLGSGVVYSSIDSNNSNTRRNDLINGSSNSRCCNSRSKWCMCGPSCYRQRRLAVLNISMCKLGRFRQFTDPSLRRSVLICNTLRYIEREMEQEGCFNHVAHNNNNNINNSNNNTVNSQQISNHYQPLITFESPPEPPRVPTPYPQQSLPPLSRPGIGEDNDSGLGDDNRSINWGSVLSLSSQSDLDPLNNNDSLGDLDFSQDFDDIVPSCKLLTSPLSVEDILKTVPSSGSAVITSNSSSSSSSSSSNIDNGSIAATTTMTCPNNQYFVAKYTSDSSTTELDSIMHVLKFS